MITTEQIIGLKTFFGGVVLSTILKAWNVFAMSEIDWAELSVIIKPINEVLLTCVYAVTITIGILYIVKRFRNKNSKKDDT